MSQVAYKAELFKAKVKVGGAQMAIARRRAKLWEKLERLITHPDDKKVVEIALRGKNMTPRYW